VFQHGASFSAATFVEGGADLSGTTLKGNHACFNGTNFTKSGASFNQATFEYGAAFGWATFERSASFIGSTLAQTAGFSETTFTLTADFREAKFIGEAKFRETTFRRDNDRLPGPVFSLAEFSHRETAVFYKTYLGQALFHNCDVSKVMFSSVDWRKRKRDGKRMVFEEIVDLTVR
jgi:uncharacterized protein YjbI with pentapeptide repeats